MLQVTGGGIDKDDISEGIINIENTIIQTKRTGTPVKNALETMGC